MGVAFTFVVIGWLGVGDLEGDRFVPPKVELDRESHFSGIMSCLYMVFQICFAISVVYRSFANGTSDHGGIFIVYDIH